MKDDSKTPGKSPRIMMMIMVTVLLVQFFFGMYDNLYINMPAQNSPLTVPGLLKGIERMISMGMTPPLMIHMLLGLIILLLGIITAVTVARSGWVGAGVLAVFAAIFIAVAGLGGLAFVLVGQRNDESYVMAASWAVALTLYFAALMSTSPRR